MKNKTLYNGWTRLRGQKEKKIPLTNSSMRIEGITSNWSNYLKASHKKVQIFKKGISSCFKFTKIVYPNLKKEGFWGGHSCNSILPWRVLMTLTNHKFYWSNSYSFGVKTITNINTFSVWIILFLSLKPLSLKEINTTHQVCPNLSLVNIQHNSKIWLCVSQST